MTKKKVFDQKSHEMSSKIPTNDIQAPAEASSSTLELYKHEISSFFPFWGTILACLLLTVMVYNIWYRIYK
jgi:hypothetical protein